MSELAMTTIGPFRVLCRACNTVAESWYRYGPAPEGATRGPATCACGKVTATSRGMSGSGQISGAPDQWEVLDPVPPLTSDTPENRVAAEQELPELAAQLGRRIWITDHGVYLVGPEDYRDDEELISDTVIGARDGLRWEIEMKEYRRSLVTQGKLPPPPESLPPQERRIAQDKDLGW